MTNSVTTVYLITNIFGTYIIYRFMNIFFDRNETDRKIEFVSYLLYYFAISLLFIAFNEPILNVVVNIVMFFVITFNYESTFKRKLIATLSIYMILMTIESIVVLFIQYFGITVVSKDSNLVIIAGMISIKIITYNVMLFLSNFKLLKNDIKVPSLHWLSIFVIPAGTLVSALMLIMEVNSLNLSGVILNIIILFVINVFVFYLYDVLMKSYDEKMEKALLQQQNCAYLNQLEVINQAQENLKIFRHDVKNHVLSLKTLIENNENKAASEYLDNIISNTNYSVEYSKTGNSEIDSILNYKLYKAEAKGLKIATNISVPEKLEIEPFDLSVILGNLLDNAIEAAAECMGEISVSVEFDRNVLYISISNTYDGKLKYLNKKLITTKKNKDNHGMGLISVQKSLEKYNGAIEINSNDKTFFVDALLYNN